MATMRAWSGIADVLLPVILTIREKIDRIGWNQRVRPAHIEYSSIPTFPGMRLLRCCFAAAIVFTLLSGILEYARRDSNR